jgi:two-component system response regulator
VRWEILIVAEPYVLVVEDNEDDEKLTRRALKQSLASPRIEVIRDGEEALKLLERWPFGAGDEPERPSLVLLDLKLPKVSGHEILEAFRAHPPTRDIHIVIVTSSDEEADIRTAWNLGADDYLKKPLDYFDYMNAVDSVVRMWLPQVVHA